MKYWTTACDLFHPRNVWGWGGFLVYLLSEATMNSYVLVDGAADYRGQALVYVASWGVLATAYLWMAAIAYKKAISQLWEIVLVVAVVTFLINIASIKNIALGFPIEDFAYDGRIWPSELHYYVWGFKGICAASALAIVFSFRLSQVFQWSTWLILLFPYMLYSTIQFRMCWLGEIVDPDAERRCAMVTGSWWAADLDTILFAALALWLALIYIRAVWKHGP